MSDNKQVSAALVKAQRAFGPALKSSTNPHFKSRYADLSACIEAVIDGLHANGLALVQKQHPHDGGVSVETIFIHESGEQLSAGILSVPAAKQDPQGYGSALTYARRYSLMAACGIAPEDDDGNAASKPRQQPLSKVLSSPDPNTGDVAWVDEEPPQDMSHKARAKRVTTGVATGDAKGAALAMSGWEKPLLDDVWRLLDAITQDKLTAVWPEAA